MEVTVNKDFITTYTKIKFSPLFPDKDKKNIIDIAHSLSHLCRGNGHLKHFYSVAQHSVNCAEEAKMRGLSEKIQLACLLHDASEAYISDITRPVKKHLPNYIEIENKLQILIYEKYLDEPLNDYEIHLVKKTDDDMLICEFNALMRKKVFDNLPEIKGDLNFETKDFIVIENQFISICRP
jgi:5'-deoxynucleotidase YfbR-like HD superfamily hydrolase